MRTVKNKSGFLFPAVFLFFGSVFFAQSPLPDSLYKEIKFDTLQICPSHFVLNYKGKTDSLGINGKQIPQGVVKKMNLPDEKEKYFGIVRFFLDPQQKLCAYVYRQAGVSALRLLVYSADSSNAIYSDEAAFYSYLPGVMSETLNTWITDINKDKVKDIAVKRYVHDFELANKYAPNITGDRKSIFLYKNGQFKNSVWTDEVLPNTQLLK